MRQRLHRLLATTPVSDPSQRQRAALLHILLIGSLMTICLAIVFNLFLFGTDARTLSRLAPILSLMCAIGGAVVVLRRGRFGWSVTIVIGAILLVQGYSLLIHGLRGNESELLVFVIPITLAALLTPRRGLIFTSAVSMAMVLGAAIQDRSGALMRGSLQPEPPLSGTVVIFVLIVCLFGFFLDRFGNARSQELTRLVAERTQQLAAANRQLQGQTRELMQANRHLQQLSYQDGLTGIANRRHFEVTLDWEWRRACRTGVPLSLIMLDLDSFKTFNDTYGHPDGDACLQQIAQLLNANLRRAADMVARYGGEEFAIILPGSDAMSARFVAETLRKIVKTTPIVHPDGGTSHVTISLGVATMIPVGDSNPAALVAAADEALYQAKRAGRDQAVVAELARVV